MFIIVRIKCMMGYFSISIVIPKYTLVSFILLLLAMDVLCQGFWLKLISEFRKISCVV